MGTSTWAIRVPDDVDDGWAYLGTRTALGDLLPMGRREEIIELLEKALAERGHPALWSNEEHETLAEGIGWLMSLDEVDGQVRMLHVSRPHQLIHEVFESVGHNKGWQVFDAGSGTRILPIGKP
jgi:hypothetical protein